MLIQRAKKTIFVCLILGALGVIGIKAMASKSEDSSELPIRKLQVNLDVGYREKLFDQLRKFSEKHGFAIRIAPTTPSEKEFSVEMWREDFKIFGDNPFDPGKFLIGIYENGSSAREIPPSYLDELVADLSVFVSGVPTAMLSEDNK